MSQANPRLRLSVIGIIVMALFSALFVRLWFLQVAAGSEAAEAATNNRVRVVQEPAIRGRILDAQGRVLVGNRVVDAVTFDRSEAISDEDKELVIGRLAELLSVDVKEVRDQVDDPRVAAFAPALIAVDVPKEVVSYIAEHQEDFPAVDAERIALREYGNEQIGAHVLGYLGEINADELETLEGRGYRLGDQIGKAGVEQMFEAELRGEPHVQRLEVDSRGRVIRVIEDRPAVPGKDIQLTIDLDVQRVAEESLRQGMEAARNLTCVSRDERGDEQSGLCRAGGGSVIVLDVRDGSVVAMASAPDYDPAEFSDGIPEETLEQLSGEESDDPLLNRAVQGTYAPGSTWKLITGLAGVDAELITPESTINDQGCITIEDLDFCNPNEEPHGAVNLSSALTVSSDVYFYELGRQIWRLYRSEVNEQRSPDLGYAIQETAREYGFGSSTGLGLSGEESGRIPDKKFKEDFNETNPNLEERRVNSLWLPGDSVNLSVGQGDLLVTPIQLANAYATFANGGVQHTPRLAAAVLEPRTGNEDAPGEVVRLLAAQRAGEVDIDPTLWQAVMEGLLGVVINPNGTAAGAFQGLEGISVAGKTGTAERAPKQDTSLFVGITPVDQPQYVAVAVVEEGGFGSSVAAPIVRRTMAALHGDPNPPPVQVAPASGTGD